MPSAEVSLTPLSIKGNSGDQLQHHGSQRAAKLHGMNLGLSASSWASKNLGILALQSTFGS